MTTQAIRYESEFSNAAAPIFAASKVYVRVAEEHGPARLLERPAAVAATTEACRIFQVTPGVTVESGASFSAFDELANEVALDPASAEVVADGRKWVAAELGNGDLASLRLAAGMSQSQLAEACGLEQPHVSRYESGRHEPSLSVSRKMAETLGVSMEQFHNAWLLGRHIDRNEK